MDLQLDSLSRNGLSVLYCAVLSCVDGVTP